MNIIEKIDEFTEKQGIVSAEWCKLLDELETFHEAYFQLVDKIKLQDGLKRQLIKENEALKQVLINAISIIGEAGIKGYICKELNKLEEDS